MIEIQHGSIGWSVLSRLSMGFPGKVLTSQSIVMMWTGGKSINLADDAAR